MFSHSLDPKGTFEDQKLAGDIVAGSESAILNKIGSE
jgi:hypothetical protein